MARLQSQFNANAIDPTQGGTLQQLPIGKHPVIIVASEIKGTKDNSGGYIEFELQCTGGPAQGQIGVLRLNVYNSSEKARQIAEHQLSALCHATGVFMLTDTQELHGKPFGVEVTAQALTTQQIEKQQKGEQVTPFTQVSKILDTNGSEPKSQGQQNQPQQNNFAQQSQPTVQQNQNWGNQPQTPAPAAQAGGWAQQQSQPPAPAPAPQNQGWSQNNAPANNTPAWGR